MNIHTTIYVDEKKILMKMVMFGVWALIKGWWLLQIVISNRKYVP
jgi:hypothetical protein